MKKRRERDRNKGVVVVEASTIGGVTSLLYGWNGCKPGRWSYAAVRS